MIKKLTITLVAVVGIATMFSIASDVSFRDSTEYLFASKNIKEQNCLYAGDLTKVLDYRLFSKRPVAYPLILAINPLSIRLVQFLLFPLLLFGFLSLLRKQKGSQQKSMVFLWLLFFTPLVLLHPGFIMADFIFSCCLFFLFSSLLNYRLRGHETLFWWSIAVLIKPVLFPTIVLWLVAMVFSSYKNRKFQVALMVPLLVIFSVFARNYHSTGVSEYSSISTINLAHYNAKLTIAKQYGLDSAESFVSDEVFEIPKTAKAYRAYSENLKALAKQAIAQNSISYITVHTIGALKMLVDPGRFEFYTFLGLSDEQSLTELLFSGQFKRLQHKLMSHPIALTLYLLLFLVSLFKLLVVGLLLLHKSSWKNPLIITSLLFIAYFLGVTGPVGAGRFFLPVVLIYNLLVVEGLYRLQKRSKR